MLRPIDEYFLQQEEPIRASLQSLRDFILAFAPDMRERWEYRMPFYYLGDQRFCYLWVHKTHRRPYIGIVDGYRLDHPGLLQEKRSRMKILLIDPAAELPLENIHALLLATRGLYGPG